MNRLRLQLQRKCLTRWYRSPPPVSSNSTAMRKRPTKLHKKWIITVTVTIRANDDHRIHTGCQPASQSFAHAQFIRKVLFLRSRIEQIFGDVFVVFFLGFSKRAVEPLNSECHYGIASPFWQLTLKSASSVKVFSIHERLHMLITLTCSS